MIYPEGVFVALVIQHEKRRPRIISCMAWWLYDISPHYLIKDKIIGKSYGIVIEYEMGVLILCTTFF
jgi:hypothetical protein